MRKGANTRPIKSISNFEPLGSLLLPLLRAQANADSHNVDHVFAIEPQLFLARLLVALRRYRSPLIGFISAEFTTTVTLAHFHLEICASFGNFPIVRSTSSEMTKSECRMTKKPQMLK